MAKFTTVTATVGYKMPLFALVPFVLMSLMVYDGKYANEKVEIAALKKEYNRQHGKNPLGPKSNDLNWLRAKTAGKDGAPGKDGRHGRPGKAGKDGHPGKAGKDGRPGKAGKDAKDVSINNTINNHYYAASGSDSDSDTLSFDEPAAGGAAAGGAAATWNAFDLYSFASRGETHPGIKTLKKKYEHSMTIPKVMSLVSKAIALITSAGGMRYPLATAAKKSVTAEHAWITARSLYDKAHASLEKLKTNAMVKKIYYQRTGLKNMDLTAGQHARLRREQSEMQQSLGEKYVKAEARVDAVIKTVELSELDKNAKLSVWQAAKAQ